MARTLTPAEWAELERAQREGGIPNVAPDSSVQIEGRHNPWGDLPTQQEQVDFRRRTTGYPRGGLGGILDRVGAGVQEEFGQAKDWAGGLLSGVDLPNFIKGGYDTADIPTEEQPEWLSAEYELSKQTGLSMEASEFFLKFSDALENSREDAQTIFNQWWSYLSPKDKDQLNVHLNISPPVEYGLAP